MKFKTLFAILLACAATGFAQDRMADTLRNGILEEDSKQNTAAAIQQYHAVLTQYAEVRQTAATALFRTAECYRKQGNRTQAIAAYQRVLSEFADQTKLAAQSRTMLASTYKVTPAAQPNAGSQSDEAKFLALVAAQQQQHNKIEEARARYRATIEEEMAFTQKQLDQVKSLQGTSTYADLEEKLIRLKRDLAAFDAGMAPSPAR
jgi:tetratricopeptide (TPR) repeat protein